MPNENLIHIKLERDEALESKRDILGSQIVLLRILKRINAYRVYRARELELKLTLNKKMKELRTNITTLQRILPQLKVPKMLRKETDAEGKKVSKKSSVMVIKDLSIEGQLQEIQRKLDDLQRKNV